MASPRTRITDTDRGYKRVMRNLERDRQGRRLQVGVKADEHTEMVAAVHEFGLGSAPERSFLRAWFDDNRGRVQDDLRRLGRQIIRGDGPTRDQLLAELGRQYRDEIQERILRGLSPELKPATLAHKAAAGDPPEPLVTSSGNLLSAIVAMLDGQIV